MILENFLLLEYFLFEMSIVVGEFDHYFLNKCLEIYKTFFIKLTF